MRNLYKAGLLMAAVAGILNITSALPANAQNCGNQWQQGNGYTNSNWGSNKRAAKQARKFERRQWRQNRFANNNNNFAYNNNNNFGLRQSILPWFNR